MNKDELRAKMRQKRREMTADEVFEKSARIQKQLFSFDKYINAKTVMLYVSAFNEPSTIEIIKDAIEQKKRVVLPVSDTATETIVLSYLDSLNDLAKGAYGISEPRTVKKADTADIDFILVPGLAFDKNGNRMGFGKGYYDKLLCKTNAEKTALCYEFQLFDEIRADKHDIPMNTIITEDKIYAI